MCGLWTRLQMDVDLPRFFAAFELTTAGAHRLAVPGEILCFLCLKMLAH